ncbi:helix-hairpin-helix domain-containing protein [Gramella sp. AN32]|uniref:ComEA family DNA-binding protein n=1 Tax=Christiangramia antarctica TaxID=2058158 RepID=A0ABW5X6Y2_9FLAO|nr:helix-hairpin-helix domain-containing protein [Gramella sp. AN32]MCM4154654.1 DNA-binding protein [Gramella sp. AN32]
MSFKSHFALSRSQQNGIFVLVGIIILLQLGIHFFDFSEKRGTEKDSPEIIAFRKELDSLRKLSVTKKDTIYPFNPNYITDFKGYQLGMSVEEIDRLLKYRTENKWMNSAEEFQKVTKVSDSFLNKIAPSFRFPEWTQKANSVKQKIEFTKSSGTIVVADLNMASAEDLMKVNGVGEVLSKRIVKYRSSLGGFVKESQLQDVYGLSPEVIAKILERFRIIATPKIEKISLKTATATQLSEIPHINYDLAKNIVSYRNLHEGITSFEELSKINSFPFDKIDIIRLYLTID